MRAPMLIAALLIAFSGLAIASDAQLAPSTPADDYQVVRGRIISIDTPTSKMPATAMIEVAEGAHSGRIYPVLLRRQLRSVLAPGDAVLVRILHEGEAALFVEPVRSTAMLWMIIIFCIIVCLVMRAAGARILLSIVAAGVLIYLVFLPLSQRGWPPMLLAWLVGVPSCAGGVLLICGWNRKSLHAIIGSITAIIVAIWLPVLLVRALALTGLEVTFGFFPHIDAALWYSESLARIDFRQVLLAGVVIAAVGATMDIAITISTALWEVRKANPDASPAHLWHAGLALGKDVFGTMAVAVILIFVGYQFELIIMYYTRGLPFGPMQLLNHEEIAAEIVHIIGIVAALGLAVPLTTAAGVYIRKREDEKTAG